MKLIYNESFDNGPGGWVECFKNGRDGIRRHEMKNGALISRSPWWVDYNHAPPGGGYLHLLYTLHTAESRFRNSEVLTAGGTNRFIEEDFPTNFTHAHITFRLRGEIELRRAQCVLLVQSLIPDTEFGENRVVPFALTGQPITITPEYSDQAITLVPDATEWTCLGSRHDRRETYGWGRIEDALHDVNVNIMLILCQLDVVPAEPLEGDLHFLRASEDFAVDRSRLPEGYVALDSVRIEFDNEA